MPLRILGRYALHAPLKPGAVWLAEDPEGQEVVVKRLSGELAEAARGELAALQLLDLPGVVRLIDDGLDESGATVLVMERALGRPFPAGAQSWEALAPLLRRVLRVLREVHAAQLVHRDLKPEHVLVAEDGAVTILDFGLASGDAARLRHPREGAVGTLRYAAPEQLIEGSRATARADLYSLGLMVCEALSGALPHDERSEEALIQSRLKGRVSLPEGLPAEAQRLLKGLLQRKPLQRIASADEALTLLKDDNVASFEQATAHWQGALEREGLVRLFAGPERLHHLRSDAAELLWRAHRGEAGPTRAALQGWLRSGHARWQDGAVQLERVGLRRLGWRLDSEPDRAALVDLLQRTCWSEAGALALALGQQAWRAGRLDEARDALAAGLLATSRLPDLPAARETARWLTVVGLSSNSDRASALALHQLHRAPEPHPTLIALLQADRALRAGELDRAEGLLIGLTEMELEALDRWRPALGIRLAQRRGPQALPKAHACARAWAEQRGTPTALGDALNWESLHAYAAGEMSRSAELAQQALALKEHGTGRLSARCNLLAALLELPTQREDALGVARALVDEAACLRHSVFEGYGEWALRTLAYREGEAGRPDWQLVEAVNHLGARALQGQLWFGEAAIAWQAGDLSAAHPLAIKAEVAWRGDGRAALPALARALALVTSESPDLEAARQLALGATGEPALPGVWLQALGALLWRWPALRPELSPTLQRLADRLPEHLRVGRRELLSVEEILAP